MAGRVDAAAPSLSPPASVEHEVLQVIARHVAVVSGPVILTLSLISALALRTQPWPGVLTWFSLSTAVLLVRRRLLQRAPSAAEPASPALRRAIVLSGLNGCVQALGLLFFPSMNHLEQSVVSLLLVGLCTAAIATTSGHPWIYRAYVLPPMVGLALAWPLTHEVDAQRWLEHTMAFLLLLYLVVLLYLARDNHRSLRRSVLVHQRKARFNDQLRQALAAATQANAAKTRFLASASHDLRQPLHSLTLFIGALQAQPQTDEGRRLLGNMNTAMKALSDELSSLLDISKLDAGTLTASPAPVLLEPLLTQLTQETRAVAQPKGLQVHLQCAPDLAVHTDGLLLARMLRHLLDNAVKYCHEGAITLKAAPDLQHPQKIVVSVQDTGEGICAEHHQRVFEEFFQISNPERDRHKGLGLGLPIVRRLADLMGIGLTLQSEPGVGTQVSLRLTRCDQAAPPSSQTAERSTEPPLCHALVVDDEASVLDAMSALLSSLGCRVSVASGLDEAVARAMRHPPDIVLADLRLRGTESGIQVVRRLREHWPDLPALLISGDTAPDRLREAEAEGLKLLHKPVSVEDMIWAMTQALDVPG